MRRWALGGAVLVALLALLAVALTAPDRVRAGRQSAGEVAVALLPGSSAADLDRIRQACVGIPDVSVTSPASGDREENAKLPLRYDVSRASNAERNALLRCLGADPAVRGASEPLAP